MKRNPNSYHWWRCQRCGNSRATRSHHGRVDEDYQPPPRTPCKFCRDKNIDYHYEGYGPKPEQPHA